MVSYEVEIVLNLVNLRSTQNNDWLHIFYRNHLSGTSKDQCLVRYNAAGIPHEEIYDRTTSDVLAKLLIVFNLLRKYSGLWNEEGILVSGCSINGFHQRNWIQRTCYIL